MCIDDFSPGLEPEDCAAVPRAGRRAAWLMKGGCGERVQRSHLPPGKDVKGESRKMAILFVRLGKEQMQKPSPCLALVEKILFF